TQGSREARQPWAGRRSPVGAEKPRQNTGPPRLQSRLALMDAIPVDVYEGELVEIDKFKC
ncbi:MAG: hypothetical protein M3R69_08070, partial [Acidobacteriota bacterium]|nr:hypothetical protein [Acidobacteriota bacterium]